MLDVGAGSGRDCAALHAMGVNAWGLEPSDELRERAITRHPELAGRFLQGSVPDELTAVANRAFHGIICSAVLMHIPNARLFEFAIAIRSLLRPRGTLVISFSTARDDVDPETERDRGGRLFIIRPTTAVQLLFERIGFRLESHWESSDALGREGYGWSTLVFSLRESSPRPIDRIESIINRDKKTSTYKLALLRSLAEIASTRPGVVTSGPRQTVTVTASQEVAGLHRNVMSKIVHAIRVGPVAYAGDNEFQYSCGNVIVHADLWREFTLMGHWISDSLLLRWSELTSSMSGGSVKPSQVVDLLMKTHQNRRFDSGLREFYSQRGDLRCAWTGAHLMNRFDVDHIIPFALRKDSSMWNLVPSAAKVNNRKRDRLPTLEVLASARERIVTDWRMVADWKPTAFQSDALRLTSEARNSNWEKILFSALVETVETAATIRGVQRWAGMGG